MRDKRSRALVFVAHCILNQNARARGVARRANALREVVDLLLDLGFGVVQLPCPELLFFGAEREPAAKQNYDMPDFRATCRRLANEIARQMQEYLGLNYRIAGVVGVEHSPSCAVSQVPSNPNNLSEYQQGMGVFMEELEEVLKSLGIKAKFVGVHSAEERAEENELVLKGAIASAPR